MAWMVGGAINVLVFRLETLTTNNFGILLRNILGLLFLLFLFHPPCHLTFPINEKHTLKWINTTMVWCYAMTGNNVCVH